MKRSREFVLPILLLLPWLAALMSFSPVLSFENLNLGSLSSVSRAGGLSALVGLIAAATASLLGIPAGWALASRRMSALRTACVVLPLALPASVAVSGWIRIVAPDAASSFALPIPGFTSLTRSFLFGPGGAGVVLGLSLWPVVALFSWPAFRACRDESYAAALSLSAPGPVFFALILRRCRKELAASIALVFLLAASDFSVCSLLLVKTLAVEAHDRIALRKLGEAAVLALPLALVCSAAVAFIGGRVSQRFTAGTSAFVSSNRKGSEFTLWIGVIFGFALPMAACAVGVLRSGRSLSASFDAGASALPLSLRLAAAVALLATGAAVVRLTLRDRPAANFCDSILLFNLCVPGALIATAALVLQARIREFSASPDLSLAWLAGASAYRFLFIPAALAAAGCARMDSALFESASAAGATPAQRFFTIMLPLTAPYLAAGACLVFVFTLGEVAIAAVLAPPGAATATLWLFNQQHMGYDESVFALSLLLGGMSAAAIALGALAVKKTN